jgi:NADH:ubiquinone oxidoreductase subunit B-like Fe-S oxidoreductase
VYVGGCEPKVEELREVECTEKGSVENRKQEGMSKQKAGRREQRAESRKHDTASRGQKESR